MSRYIQTGSLWLTEHRNTAKMNMKDSFMLSHPAFCDRNIGICRYCYSRRMSNYRPNLKAKQESNSCILSDENFVPSKIYTIDGTLRWSSTGEIENKTQYNNICRMAEENPHIQNVLWTKRAGLVRDRKKPDNLTLVWSATKLDVKNPFVPYGFDIGFFCYTKRELMPFFSHECRKSCSECSFCYSKGAVGLVCELVRTK